MCIDCRKRAMMTLSHAMASLSVATCETDDEDRTLEHHIANELAFVVGLMPSITFEEVPADDDPALVRASELIAARMGLLSTHGLMVLGHTTNDMADILAAAATMVGRFLTMRADDGDPDCQNFSASAMSAARAERIGALAFATALRTTPPTTRTPSAAQFNDPKHLH